jgi:hypothetical protein
MARHAALGVRHVIGRSSPKNRAKGREYPRELERGELLAMIAGPAAYLAGRWTCRGERPVTSRAQRSRVVAR